MPVPSELLHTYVAGGGTSVKRSKTKVIEEPNIVKTYTFGNTTVHIADNYIARTPEEIEKVDKAVHEVLWRIVEEMEQKRTG